jgi:MFS family permease
LAVTAKDLTGSEMTLMTISQRSRESPPAPLAGSPERPQAPPAGGAANGRHRLGFWLIAYAFTVTMAFATVPTPLYVLYQARDGFGPFTLTLIFAAYAAGVALSLLFAGHISDWLGRKRVLVPAVLVNVASGIIFLAWPAVPGLFIARFVAGISIGMLTATATAHLTELHLAARPGASRSRADVVATAANLGGIGLGPLMSGLLAQYAPDPLHVPFYVAEALMLAGVLVMALVPETVNRPEPRPAYRPQRVSVPPAARPVFLAAGGAGAVVFAMLGLFTSLAPSFLAGTLHDDSHALAGAIAFLVLGASAASQIMLARSSLRRQFRLGFGMLAIGIAAVTAAIWVVSLPLLVIGGVLAGVGIGATFKGAVSTVIDIAPVQARGEALAGLFLASYIGLAVPVVGLGIATQYMSAQVALLIFAAALLAGLGAVTRLLLRHSAR